MANHSRTRLVLLLALSLLGGSALIVACAPKPPVEEPAPVTLRPLERMAGQEILVLPIQYLSFADTTLGWHRALASSQRSAYLAAVDTAIAAALTARGLGHAWTFGPEVARASRLNSILGADARALAAEWLRGRVLPEQTVRDPLAQQVRSLVGLKGSRYALLPVELRFERVPAGAAGSAGTGVATLRIVMIDARRAEIRWVGEVRSDPARTFTPALAASIATRFADLVVAP